MGNAHSYFDTHECNRFDRVLTVRCRLRQRQGGESDDAGSDYAGSDDARDDTRRD